MQNQAILIISCWSWFPHISFCMRRSMRDAIFLLDHNTKLQKIPLTQSNSRLATNVKTLCEMIQLIFIVALKTWQWQCIEEAINVITLCYRIAVYCHPSNDLEPMPLTVVPTYLYSWCNSILVMTVRPRCKGDHFQYKFLKWKSINKIMMSAVSQNFITASATYI